MIEPKSIDHITLCVENLDEAEFLFTKVLGFEVIWSARDVGTDKSSMDTVVVAVRRRKNCSHARPRQGHEIPNYRLYRAVRPRGAACRARSG